ncbi:asparagine synthase (glutamine-hydrolyzing) [Erythrobacteraceae bacterium CFH 75059]|uniref:asparagine synthase (glutamine-hydrolyzing) n=1 Tax=Qipengyuania thermophila TaxID=2509361 RepID=UPI0010206021|nr:asparagine synthase (glutamine-hydrolyzing) [Qipengyuania thermophila]TCD04318.1 asparagine synthase (glutamine-hydrolyzing) [Erythrobacteraceae bacterium CFH 75059]
MCGLAGFVTAGPLGPDAMTALRRMTGRIAHRGPDSDGHWLDEARGVALGHRRLAILDLSEAGHQPMRSPSGRLVLVFNGEIYNHRELRARLEREGEAPDWRGHSDTEVLLACMDRWGVRTALEQANGMFALAVWDRRSGVLTLARDRLGEKPLYYGWQDSTFFFASELKAIAAHPQFAAEVDRDSLAAFMSYGYVPAPLSIWKGIRKLPPAHLAEVEPDRCGSERVERYWDLAAIAVQGASAPFDDTPELVDRLDALLRDAVGLRMEADVPLGAFLSGGVDSSLVTALMQSLASRPVKTFSIGFDERGYDESAHARAVARHLGTDHCELRVAPRQAQEVLPRLPTIWDEPFADSSQVPTFLVNALAREKVTVALSGDGGDELFAGYNRHVLGARIWQQAAHLPLILRRGISAALAAPLTARAVSSVARAVRMDGRIAGLAERLPKVGAVIAAGAPGDFYTALVSQWPAQQNPVLGVTDGRAMTSAPAFADFRNTMLYFDATTYLPDDILAKVDRAGMAVSLEGRIPFLDHRVVEFAWRVPLSAKIRDGRGKHILRQVLYRYVPAALIDRPKAGFAVPIGAWLSGPLRPWAEALLDPAAMRAQGFLDDRRVTQTWQRFLRGDKHLLTRLWCVLMFQAWLQEQQDQRTLALRAAA